MNQRPLLIANWKMNFSVAEAVDYAQQLVEKLQPHTGVEFVLCPHHLAIAPLRDVLADSGILLGAQDAHWKENGAYTGQVSASMLRDMVDYVIVGHSETRSHLCVSNEMVRKKLMALLENGLQAIVCVGENENEFLDGVSDDVVRSQVKEIFRDASEQELSRVVIAYEPIWAIGTGQVPVPSAVNLLVQHAIRQPLAEQFGEPAANSIRVVYGGSVKSDNLPSFCRQNQLNGTLVGGSSLRRRVFLRLARITQRSLGA